jgi:hypothetical protein
MPVRIKIHFIHRCRQTTVNIYMVFKLSMGLNLLFFNFRLSDKVVKEKTVILLTRGRRRVVNIAVYSLKLNRLLRVAFL